MNLAIVLYTIIILLIGVIIGIYLREGINVIKRKKPPDELGSEFNQIMNWIETGKENKR